MSAVKQLESRGYVVLYILTLNSKSVSLHGALEDAYQHASVISGGSVFWDVVNYFTMTGIYNSALGGQDRWKIDAVAASHAIRVALAGRTDLYE